jgi:phosphoribosylformimino-5-aminoimidazole carboxamide ribotide isomerase
MGEVRSGGFVVAPAIDVLEGRCVRLRHGQREHVVVEGGDPAAAAARFAGDGARLVHLVDLDGAFSGAPTPGLVERVAAAASPVPVQVGGGLRTPAAVEAALAAGAARVLVGTAALSEAFLAEVARHGERVAVAVDAREGHVAVDGWTGVSELTAVELARRCAGAGIVRLVVTSTRRDGSLEGPDLDLLREVGDASALPVIAAGGIASVDDLRRLREFGCEGAIVGSALWLGRFTLAEALAAVAD